MYIDQITLENFRSFRSAQIDLVHPDRQGGALEAPALRWPNINLLLGDNGLGKTTLLKAIALACLGPAVGRSGIFPYRLIRREPVPAVADREGVARERRPARIAADFTPHEQDGVTGRSALQAQLEVQAQGDLEVLEWVQPSRQGWEPIYSAESDAFFFVGYGATRRVEQHDRFDPGARNARRFPRAQRVASLFEEAYSLVPLSSWLPEYRQANPGRYTQVVHLLNRLMGEGHYQFTGDMEEGDYVFSREGQRVPFPALSDGYRAYLGWVGDLLYHVCMTCPSGKKLVDNCGIVMVDEIDLHLHPKWQMTVLPTLAQALPRIQFVVTSHSPLVVGSLQWHNIITMQPTQGQASTLARIPTAVHGLDADQVLLTGFFGLESTRAPGREQELKALSLQARGGDPEAALRLLRAMGAGAESEFESVWAAPKSEAQ